MADDRAFEDTPDQVSRLQTELDDLKSTILARVLRRPTGDIEPTLRTTPKQNTLLLDGSAVSRATYAELWQWAQDNGLIVTGLFTSGDGSTTFGLPDLRGRVVRGKPAAEAIGALTGADSLALVAGNLPSHTHTFTTAGSGNHGHSFSTDGAGSHGGHVAQAFNAAGGGVSTVTADNSGNANGFHSHTGGTTNVADHTHTGTTAATGTGTAMDNRQASININWAIWI